MLLTYVILVSLGRYLYNKNNNKVYYETATGWCKT
ncbi:hypothetical protein LCGC14_2498440, partial [marine sediment metagenome]